MILQIGSSGKLVELLQRNLNKLGFNCGKVDNIFGTKTKDAVIKLQIKYGLKIKDGKVGRETQYTIAKALQKMKKKIEFKMKYEIVAQYLPKDSKRRSGKPIEKVGFFVAHDTGNEDSTAKGNVKYFINSAFKEDGSAHVFVDDKIILECVPLFTSKPEKAHHVLYDKPKDNQIYGDDANDIAGGVELCYGKNINPEEAYKRYVWLLAYGCYKFKLNPKKAIVGHMILDPQRRTDPKNALSKMGKSYEQLLKDVVNEYKNCLSKEL